MPDGATESQSVLILGGGVAGMTAAHELAERGFRVTVLERRRVPGGKARSMSVPGLDEPGLRPLPAEHGFRFFPGFYQHIPDTMRRIPFGSNANGVYDNLRESTRAMTARAGLSAVEMPTRIPGTRDDRRVWRRSLVNSRLGIPVRDLLHFGALLVKLLASCDRRRYEQYEQQTWWEFSGAATRSENYQKFLADGLTRSLVAAKARQMSARTGGYILLQLLQSFGPHPVDRGVDRVLNGPTNEAWIGPWLEHLVTLGVDYRKGISATALELDGHRVSQVQCVTDSPLSIVPVGSTQLTSHKSLSADWVIAALPVEEMIPLVNAEMVALEPALGELKQLTTRWMNGVMFYLNRPVPITHGHVIYIDSPWSLTSVSQGQFWDHGLEPYGDRDLHDGPVVEILSVDVSDWEQPGILYGRTAMECTPEEIVAEVWMQLKEHLNVDDRLVLTDEDLVGAFIDGDIARVGRRANINLEPLLINTKGSWATRPVGSTAIDNLFLASDYVRTYTDLATMEGANEAARRAVNALLDRTGSRAERCRVFPLHEPMLFRPLQFVDRIVYRLTHGRHRDAPLGPGAGQ